MQTLIIINNSAAKAKRVWPLIEQQLNDAGIPFERYETKAAGDASIKARNALHSGTTTVAVVGGDGTLSEAAEGFFEFNNDLAQPPRPINPDAALAILPAGTGDDFARGMQGKRATLSPSIELLLSHLREPNAMAIDVLYGRSDAYQTPFICLNASTMGIGGETARRVLAQGSFMRRFSGEFRFAFAAVGALGAWRERRVSVVVDGREFFDGPMNLTAVANGLYAGGGMMLSPAASIEDGLLDVLTASGLTRLGIVRELARIHNGGHLRNPKVKLERGRLVRIETFMAHDAMPIEADGNLRGVTPVQFEVLPRALKFVM
ncbi:MAG: hypothetical protein C5B55_15060 [Blastocatellia bacterium]|nr:MAG: hypothetical protein C5B55_15060 [Blastocatellia bacterium]